MGCKARRLLTLKHGLLSGRGNVWVGVSLLGAAGAARGRGLLGTTPGHTDLHDGKKTLPAVTAPGTHTLFHLGLQVLLWPHGSFLGPLSSPLRLLPGLGCPGLTFEGPVWGPSALELGR